MNSEWQDLLGRFPLASPELLARRELRRRTDTKFVLSPAAAGCLLRELARDYAVLASGTKLIASYQTLYFDTPGLEFFHAHRRGRRVRHKARIRQYVDRNLAILEIKTRRNEFKTVKISRERPYGNVELTADDQSFVDASTGIGQNVIPQTWTHFQRVTLLSLDAGERVTLDLNLSVGMDGSSRSLEGIVIVEVKQWPYRRTTSAMSALRTIGLRPGWASKYCTAIALTRPGVRLNRLLPGLRALERGVA